MAMTLEDLFVKMKNNEVSTHSELGIRDESRQSKNFTPRIQRYKSTVGINARIMPMKDVVIPFNPFTGKEDDMYNAKAPFRPILLVSQVLELLNKACSESPDLKAFWEKELGITIETDKEPTMEEYYAFKSHGYIKPRIMTFDTVSLNFNGKFGFPEFKTRYLVDSSELNPQTRSYDWETAPIHHKVYVFFRAMLKPEEDAMRAQAEKAGVNKETIASQAQAIRSKSPVGAVTPTNIIPFLFFPLDQQPPEMNGEDSKVLESYMRYMVKNDDKIGTAMEEALKKNVYDEDMDFFDFTIKTPSASAVKSNGAVYTDKDTLELYKAMTITVTDGRQSMTSGNTDIDGKAIANSKLFAPIKETAKKYFLHSQEESTKPDGESFEKIITASTRYPRLDSVMENFLPACNEVFTTTFANSKYFTDEIRKANAEVLTAMNPNNAMLLAAEDDEDLKAAAAGNKVLAAEILEADRDDDTLKIQEMEFAAEQ